MATGKVFTLYLIALVINWTYAEARYLAPSATSEIEVIHKPLEGKEQLCTLCEEYTALATDYLEANKTEAEIVETLHQACTKLHSLEQQCVILVDYYAQLFFVQVTKIHPEEFCKKVNLCEKTSVFLPNKDDTCTLCHQVVVEILAKLKDPDSQMEIIEVLLKECNKMNNYVKECKRLVFQYGPLILANGEKYLESADICTSVHACKANEVNVAESLVSDA